MMYRKFKLPNNSLKSLGVTVASMLVVLAVASIFLIHWTVVSNATSGINTVQTNVIVSTYCQLTVANTAINFGIVSPGFGTATNNAVGVNSVGNTNANVQIEGTTWASLANSMTVGNTLWAPNIAGQGVGNALTLVYANTVILPFVAGTIPQNNVFFGLLGIPANQPAGIYTQTITFQAYCPGTTNSLTSTVTATMNVPLECFISDTPNTVIQFGSLNPGSNTPFTSNNVIVGNPGGSVQAQILVAGGNWVNGANNFFVANTVWAATNTPYGTSTTPLALYPPLSNLAATGINEAANSNAPIYFGVAVPGGQPAANYGSNIILENSC